MQTILHQEVWQPYRRAERSNTLLAEHAEYLRERAPKVQYSAQILFQELRRERNYRGSYETVKRFVRPLRAVGSSTSQLTSSTFTVNLGRPLRHVAARAPGRQRAAPASFPDIALSADEILLAP